MRRSALVLLSLCVAVVGCDKAEDEISVTGVGAVSLFDPTAVNPSLCGAPAIPFPNNALFASATSPTGLTTDATLNIPSAASTAVAANLTDGWSTTASAFFDVVGLVDYASAANGLIVLETAPTPRILTLGVDYTVQPSIAMGQATGTGGCALDANVNTGLARFLPILQQRSRILIEPLIPLKASTTYIVAVTKGLKAANGASVAPNEFFPILNSDTRMCRLRPGGVNLEAGTEIACDDAAAPNALAASIDPVLGLVGGVTVNPATGAPVPAGPAAAAIRLTTLETLRRNLVRPTVTAFRNLANPLLATPVDDDDLVIAWSFTTQSIGATLQTLNAIQTAKTFAVANTGLTTAAVGLPGTADIFAGTLNGVPYYLDDAAGVNDPAPLTGFWHNNGAVTAPANGGFVPFASTPAALAPCTGAPFNFLAPVSTTNCYRIPVANGNDAQGNPWGSLENLPVIITVPNATSGQTKPASGWPVVIFQHGITGNRTQALAIAPTLASAGFVVVSIDLPLHGLVPAGSVATCGSTANNAFYIPGGVERTFDLDLVNNVTGAAGPDGITDCSGTHFINLSSLITSRDNNRQAVADLIHLVKSLQAADPVNLDGAAGDDIDETKITFAGISLGSIVGTTLLGVDTGANATADGTDEGIGAASLSVPGGGLGKLLDASATFGPRIAAGLAGTAFAGAGTSGTGSPFEGTDTYETFVRFAQHLVDPGDPVNYAVSANANHRIHMTEVIGDTVVPNNATTTCPAPNLLTPGIGATAAPDNSIAATRQAACIAGGLLVGPNQVTGAPTNACPGIAAAGVCAGTASKDEVLLTGFLSGTEPLFGEMGLTVAGPITPDGVATAPPACANNTNAAGLHIVVQYAIGTHGSLLTPAGPGGATQFLAVTGEMQRQVATFLASNGQTLAGTGCP